MKKKGLAMTEVGILSGGALKRIFIKDEFLRSSLTLKKKERVAKELPEFKKLQSMIIRFVNAPAFTNEAIDVYGEMVIYTSSVGKLITPEDLEE